MHNFTLALVTGATSGIGEALSVLLAQKGVNLILTGRDTEKLQLLSEKLRSQVKVETISADLSKTEGVQILAAKIRERLPDLVINNAGFGLYGEAFACDFVKQREMVNVNSGALMELTLESARSLIDHKKKGVILNVSSAAPFQVMPLLAVYSATKAFVNEFSESLDYETAPYDVRVLATCPGVVATNFQMRAGGKSRQIKHSYGAMTPEFAAEQIWWQVQKGKSLYIFNWKYRISAFLAQYLLPKSWVARIVRNNFFKSRRL